MVAEEGGTQIAMVGCTLSHGPGTMDTAGWKSQMGGTVRMCHIHVVGGDMGKVVHQVHTTWLLLFQPG